MHMMSESMEMVRRLGWVFAGTADARERGEDSTLESPLTITPDARDIMIAGSPDRRIAGSPDRRIAGSPDRRIAGSPDRRIAGSPDRRIAGSPDRRIAGSPDRRIAGSPDRPCCVRVTAMSVPAWLRRSRRPSSPPELSSSAGRHSAARRPASSSGSSNPASAQRVLAACASGAGLRLRRGLRPVLASALLALPLLAGLPTGAQAQVACSTANADGSYDVPFDWALKPSGLAAGTKFRLLFATSTRRNASATDIATYNTFVQTRAKAGHSAISDSCGNLFKVVGSTSAIDARVNTDTESTDTAALIYWLNGAKVADSYADFYDGSWDSRAHRTESGGTSSYTFVFTGSNQDGTKSSSIAFGAAAVSTANLNSGGPLAGSGSTINTATHRFLALSPIFTVGTKPVVSISAGTSPVTEGTAASFTLSVTPAPSAPLPVGVAIGSGGDFVLAANLGNKTVTIPAGAATHAFTVPTVNDTTDEDEGSVPVAVTSGTGYTVGNPGIAIVDVTDNDATLVSLVATSDVTFTEETPSDTAAVTVRLARRLYAGEKLAVPFEVTGRGIALHEQVNPSYTLSVSGNGATGTLLTSATTYVRFTGHDTDIVQEATVTLTPTSNDDGDTEAGSATIGILDLFSGDWANSFTTVGGGGAPGPDTSVRLVYADNDGTFEDLILRDLPGPRIHLDVQASPDVTGSGRDWTLEEGTDITLRISNRAETLHTQDLTVNYNVKGAYKHVSEANLETQRGTREVTLPANTRSVQVTLNTEATTDDETDVSLSVRLLAATVPGTYTTNFQPLNFTVTDGSDGGTGAIAPFVTVERWWPGFADPRNEGEHLPFVIRSNPAAQVPFPVWLKVEETAGDCVAAGLERVHTVRFTPGTELRVLRVPTVDDGVDEPDCEVRVSLVKDTVGTVPTVTEVVLTGGRGAYIINPGERGPYIDETSPENSVPAGRGRGTATGTVFDNDPGSFDRGGQIGHSESDAAVDPALVAEVRVRAAETHHGQAHVDRWRRVLVAFGVETYEGLSPTTAAEAAANAKKYSSPLWPRIATALAALEAGPVVPVRPVVTIAADAEQVGEGGAVTFTLTAAPAPARDLAVHVVADEEMGAGDDLVGSGHIATVTIPAGESSATWTVTAMSDEVERADGTMTGRVVAGDGYAPGDPSEVTLALLDDDEAALEVTVSGGDAVTEGGDAVFTFTASPAPASDLAVTVTVAVEGAYGVTAGTRTVTVPAAGSATLTLATANDDVDEADGSITLTVEDGDGYTAGDPASGTVAVRDDDVPAVRVAAGDAVTEGGDAVFTLTASPAPAAALTVTVTVAAAGDYGVTAGTRTVTVPTTGSATLTLTTANDKADEADGSVTLTVDAGSGYTVGAPGSGTVAVHDDDDPAVSVAAGDAVTEGGDAAFTLTADPAPASDLTVTVTVAVEGEYGVTAGKRTVTVPVSGSAVLTLATTNDEADEPDGSVTLTVDAGEGYTVGDPASGTVAVRDDDEPLPLVISVADATVTEGDTASLMWFTVRLSEPSAETVTARADTRPSTPVSAKPREDYWPVRSGLVRFRAGETEQRVPVYIADDNHDEDAETFELVLSAADGARIGDGVAVGTIVNDDPMPAAWLARFGRTVAEQALDGIAGRMAAPRTPGMQGAIAGQALSFGAPANDNAAAGHVAAGSSTLGVTGSPALADVAQAFGGHSDRFGAGDSGHDAAGFGPGPGSLSGAGFSQSQTMTARDALLGSSFSLTGAADGSGGSMAFWGRAAQARFDGREGTFSLDGAVTTGMLGADYARGKWLVGLALAQSEGEGDYRDTGADPRSDSQTCPAIDGQEMPEWCNGAVRAGDGSVEASLTAAIPYAALQASERLKLWGAAGYGTGEVTLKTALGGSYRADTTWSMAAAGLRGDLLAPPAEGSGPALAVTSDALWTRTSSEKTRDLAASDSDATRLRLGLEGSYRMALEGGGHLTPKLEIGARHDGGDAETGFGVELGGGIVWTDPALGLSLDVSGRTLIAHGNDDLRDRGYAASLAFDPDPATQRGPSLSLRQEFGGQAQGGLDALFQPATLEDRTGGSEAASRWAMEAAYGFPAFGGRWTGSPHVGLGLATAARDYSVGWRLTPAANANAPDISFGLKATRRESDSAAPEHAIGFEAVARW